VVHPATRRRAAATPGGQPAATFILASVSAYEMPVRIPIIVVFWSEPYSDCVGSLEADPLMPSTRNRAAALRWQKTTLPKQVSILAPYAIYNRYHGYEEGKVCV